MKRILIIGAALFVVADCVRFGAVGHGSARHAG